MYWWMRSEHYKGDVVHDDGKRVKVFYRSRFPDDDTYALVIDKDGKLKILAFLWLGELIDPMTSSKFFWED